MKGRIHSFQTLGGVDGPGIRFVLFMQGCHLCCSYCHNPDTWDPDQGTVYQVEQMVAIILRYRPYFQGRGGVTVSGGEALLQWQFVSLLFARLRELGIHTALDTSGIGDLTGARQVLAHTNLVLCDLKFATPFQYQTHCQAELQQVLRFLQLTNTLSVPLWIRHVIIPGYTDQESQVDQIVQMAMCYDNLTRIELLPFHNLCLHKYQSLNKPFAFAHVPPCDAKRLIQLKERIPAPFAAPSIDL